MTLYVMFHFNKFRLVYMSDSQYLCRDGHSDIYLWLSSTWQSPRFGSIKLSQLRMLIPTSSLKRRIQSIYFCNKFVHCYIKMGFNFVNAVLKYAYFAPINETGSLIHVKCHFSCASLYKSLTDCFSHLHKLKKNLNNSFFQLIGFVRSLFLVNF